MYWDAVVLTVAVDVILLLLLEMQVAESRLLLIGWLLATARALMSSCGTVEAAVHLSPGFR